MSNVAIKRPEPPEEEQDVLPGNHRTLLETGENRGRSPWRNQGRTASGRRTSEVGAKARIGVSRWWGLGEGVQIWLLNPR